MFTYCKACKSYRKNIKCYLCEQYICAKGHPFHENIFECTHDNHAQQNDKILYKIFCCSDKVKYE